MTPLAFTRSGSGAPLVLLHGLGSSRRAWDPVIPLLARRFDVIAIDLPGFGDSAPLPAPDEPQPAALAGAVAGLLDDLGVTAPHLAGNSLGGWVALELAAARPAASLTLLSPAGLWRASTPWYDRVSLRASRWLAGHAAGILSRLVSYRLGRALILGQTHGRPMHLSPGYARAAVAAMGTSPGFDAALRATAGRRYLAGAPIAAPVTVAFGSRDILLLRGQSRHRDQLPAGTEVQELPSCGHVPMADDPDAVATIITRTAGRATMSRLDGAEAPVNSGRQASSSPISSRTSLPSSGRGISRARSAGSRLMTCSLPSRVASTRSVLATAVSADPSVV
jgi:pimeloyl-ACP methyl ester carboxylesterase